MWTPASHCRRAASRLSMTMRKKQYTVGASGGGSTTVMYPAALNMFAGSKFQNREERLFRHQRYRTGQWSVARSTFCQRTRLPGILVRHPWLDRKRGSCLYLYQAALKRHRLLPNCANDARVGVGRRGACGALCNRQHGRSWAIDHRYTWRATESGSRPTAPPFKPC